MSSLLPPPFVFDEQDIATDLSRSLSESNQPKASYVVSNPLAAKPIQREQLATSSTSLACAIVGKQYTIQHVQDEDTRLMGQRLGLVEGATCRVQSKIPFGPTVLLLNGVELALGQEMAVAISVVESV